MALLEAKPGLSSNGTTTTSVFETGKYEVKSISVDSGDSSITHPPPKSLLIITPTKEGTYPVLLFLHGFALYNSFYSQLLTHIASHGYISIAPQLYNPKFPTASGYDEINSAADVTNWFPQGLQSLLPENVEADLTKLALAGHSRGGKAAFALKPGSYAQTSLTFSVLIGIDPVAGTSKAFQVPPVILTNREECFNLGIPVMVVGTGLGDNKANPIFCSCAPKGVNHEEFFKECKPTRGHMVATDYGHMDMLNDDPMGINGWFSGIACKKGSGSREIMRKCVGGIVVASIKAYVGKDTTDLKAIVDDPTIAPTTLDSVVLDEA
ncbi:chlorophyllase-1, chloroplastic-like [Macadamia integrifolia]|uniref:chlorophyllase-1, chloroplastic-like n=1 Tax=Macadamia integrifolia TaxID=60698 RepID=UPI001C4F7ED5|nr:chlorophyllase-1, chloroplastic-like [Macadamia integrifolia]